jgi:TP901 family phage tail tape measure protein
VAEGTQVGKGYVGIGADTKDLQSSLTSLGSMLGGKMGPVGALLGDKLGGAMGKGVTDQLGGPKSGILQLSGMLSKAGPWGIAAGAAVAAAAAIGVGLYKLGGSFEEQYRTIARATGATGKEMENLKTAFKNVAKTTPASFGEISQAIIGIQRYTGPSGAALEHLSTQILTLSRITKTDAKVNVEAFTHAMEAWKIPVKDAGPAMDALYRASQKSGVGFSQLAGDVTKFTPQLKTMGFSFNDGVSAIAQWSKEGLNTGKVMMGMQIGAANIVKSQGKSSAAMQKASEEVAKYEGALAKAKPGSKEAENAAASLAKAQDKLTVASSDVAKKQGVDIPNAMKDAIKGIKDAKDPTDALNLAIETFGKRGAVTMVDAIRSGKFNFDEMSKSVNGSNNAIKDTAKQTATLQGSFGKLGNKAKVALEPISTATFKGVNRGLIEMTNGLSAAIDWLPHLGDAWRDVYSFIDQWTRRIYQILTPFRQRYGQMWTQVGRIMIDVWHVVEPIFKLWIDGFKFVWDVLHGDWGAAGRALKDMVKDIGRALAGIPKLLFDLLTSPFRAIGPNVSRALDTLWSTVGAIPGKIINFLASLPGDIWNFFSGVFGTVWEAAEAGIAALWGWVTGISGRIIGGWANIAGDIWSSITGFFGTVWQAAESGIAAFWGWVSGIAGRVVSGWANIGSSVWSSISGFFGRVVGAAESGISGFWGWVSGIAGRVLSGLSNVAGAVTGAISSAFSAVLGAAEGAISGLWGWLSGLGGKIKGYFNIDLAGAGRAIIESLVGGITAVAHKVTDAVSNVVNKAKALLPGSPAKEGPFSGHGYPLYSGIAIAESLAAGISKGTPAVSMALGKMLATPMSVPGLTGGTTAAGAGAAGYGGPAVVIQNATFNEGLDVEAFMKKASWVVQTQRI